MRPGTPNLLGVVGFGKAAEIASLHSRARCEHVRKMRRCFWEKLSEICPESLLNGHPDERLPGNLNITVPGVEAQALQSRLGGSVAFSQASACLSNTGELSHVLIAIGLNPQQIACTFRVGISETNSTNEVEEAAIRIAEMICRFKGR